VAAVIDLVAAVVAVAAVAAEVIEVAAKKRHFSTFSSYPSSQGRGWVALVPFYLDALAPRSWYAIAVARYIRRS
jgi:hypothetical protein